VAHEQRASGHPVAPATTFDYRRDMASTLTKILLHITFSTKHRAELIPEALENDLYSYIGGICRRMDSPLLAMGGTMNHVHMMVSLGKTVALSNLMLEVKRDSSMWIKERDAALRAFAWQDGYFGFSIGESGVDALRTYIADQKQHHKTIDFKDEVRALLRKYGVEWDERYIWD
jgi:REP element-mobilizing transposase RayT